MPRRVSILKTISLTSRLISSVGMPRIAIAAAVGHAPRRPPAAPPRCPDISSATSKPSTMSSSANTSRSVPLARIDGERRAHPDRELAAVGIRLADDDVAGAGVAGDGGRHQPDRPGPADTARPRRGPGRRAPCGPRCRTGRRSRRPPRRRPASGARRWSSAGRRTRRTPRRGPTPSPIVLAHRWRRPARQWRQRPQTTWPSPRDEVARRGSRRRCSRPRRSRRRTRGRRRAAGGSSCAAHGSHDSMWRSVPQMPVLWTRIRTSLMPMVGIGTSRRSRPGPGPVLTRASIVSASVARRVAWRAGASSSSGPRTSR